MLGIIKEALTEAINEQPVAQSKEEVRWAKIAAFLRMNHIIQNVDVQNLLDVSPATASRVLNTLTKKESSSKYEMVATGHINWQIDYVQAGKPPAALSRTDQTAEE